MLALLSATILTAACGTGPAQGQSQSSDLTSRLISDATQTAESVVATVSERLGVKLPTPAPLSDTVVPAPVEKTPAAAPARRRPARALPSPVTEAVIVPPVAPVQEVQAPPAEPQPEPVPTPVITRLEDTTVVYTSANAEVAPPRSPSPTPLRPWRADSSLPGPSVEVTVASDGSVEKVRMFAVGRLSDMMILSHIKSWRFEPAQRDGEAVRYRILLADPLVAP
jgi:outer membrane biosynthesis protein TonB